MAKVFKYCASCEGGYAEKFTFCPDCGGALAAYEMNPIADKTGNTEAKIFVPVAEEKAPIIEKSPEPVVTDSYLADDDEDELLELESSAETVPPAADKVVPETISSDFQPSYAAARDYQSNSDSSREYTRAAAASVSGSNRNYDDGVYHITFVEEKNGTGRNLLLLGSFLLVTTVALGGLLYSLFSSNVMVGALGSDDSMLAYIADDVPAIEEMEVPKKNKDDGGGGGGGGKENPEPATKGRLPNQVDNPIMPPQPLPKVTNASLPNPQETQGKIKRDATDEPVGIPTGALSDRLSSGSGTGGGIGNGSGTGVGGGRGTGEGNGIGSGSGNGIGNGNGNGRGDGDGDRAPEPPPRGPTKTIAILSKPRPSYTDAARQNQVTGVVRLRVTFLASGQIGSVTPVSGLSYGLTEQAIAAAKQIRFQPALENGVPKTVTKQIEYSFSIY